MRLKRVKYSFLSFLFFTKQGIDNIVTLRHVENRKYSRNKNMKFINRVAIKICLMIWQLAI